jgi:hypothetical protein
MNHWNGLPRLVRERAPKIIQRALNVLIIGAPTPKVPGPAPLPARNDAAINAYFESQPELDLEEDLDLIPDIPSVPNGSDPYRNGTVSTAPFSQRFGSDPPSQGTVKTGRY